MGFCIALIQNAICKPHSASIKPFGIGLYAPLSRCIVRKHAARYQFGPPQPLVKLPSCKNILPSSSNNFAIATCKVPLPRPSDRPSVLKLAADNRCLIQLETYKTTSVRILYPSLAKERFRYEQLETKPASSRQKKKLRLNHDRSHTSYL
ncbi:hypothetical protein NPIL_64721 [Nephila pilipes]|uniref:Uncharacterized protein n=1 Tax=Nephila pilipes TaxID=299642 RepID=A0A8X6NBE5_NEPPI|nr:hypothetical protein NPIL_64721 [Nephila pilipes]